MYFDDFFNVQKQAIEVVSVKKPSFKIFLIQMDSMWEST
jgi:hypothetical protein